MLSEVLTIMNLNKILQHIGLSDKEAKIYLTLLEFKEALPSTISRRSGVKRPTTYVVLDQLQKQGLVSHVKKGKLEYFQPVNPHSLLEREYGKYHALEEALPELLQMHQKYAVTPQMQVFEGKDEDDEADDDQIDKADVEEPALEIVAAIHVHEAPPGGRFGVRFTNRIPEHLNSVKRKLDLFKERKNNLFKILFYMIFKEL